MITSDWEQTRLKFKILLKVLSSILCEDEKCPVTAKQSIVYGFSYCFPIKPLKQKIVFFIDLYKGKPLAPREKKTIYPTPSPCLLSASDQEEGPPSPSQPPILTPLSYI